MFLSNDLLSIPIPKLTSGQTTKEVKGFQSHDRDMQKPDLIWFWIIIANLEVSNSFHPCQARGQQPHFILFLDTCPFASSNATALRRALGNEVEVLTVAKALPPMEEPLKDWLKAPEVAEAISKMVENDQKRGDEALIFEIVGFDVTDMLSYFLNFLAFLEDGSFWKHGTKWVTDRS